MSGKLPGGTQSHVFAGAVSNTTCWPRPLWRCRQPGISCRLEPMKRQLESDDRFLYGGRKSRSSVPHGATIWTGRAS